MHRNRLVFSLLATSVLYACTTTPASTPIPTDEFTAVGRYSNAEGSIEVATERAERFCKHWGAKPGILTSETVDLRKIETVRDAANDTAKKVLTVSLFDKQFHHETTLTYRCY